MFKSGHGCAVGGLTALRRDVLRKVRQVGVWQTFRHGTQKLARALKASLGRSRALHVDSFDLLYGTDTAQIEGVGALDIPDNQLEHANRYEAVDPAAFDALMRALPVAYEGNVFVDIGSGKGRAVLLASRFPFREIIGIELSERLAAQARKNVSIFRDDAQRCGNISVVCADATRYELPPWDTVLFLYNPFDKHGMRQLHANVARSIQKHPRRICLAYHQAVHRSIWDESNTFDFLKSVGKSVIYRSKGDSVALGKRDSTD
jgi:SAM-dependent methyltransferase